MLGPRQTISWDEYFMSLTIMVAQKSKDNSTQVGAVIVDNRNCVIGVGFNGPPPKIPDDEIPWDREGKNELSKKYIWISHAEDNALSFSNPFKLKNSKIYVSLFPCAECAKKIIQNELIEVIYLNDRYHDTESCIASRQMFNWAGIKTRQFIPERDEISIKFKP